MLPDALGLCLGFGLGFSFGLGFFALYAASVVGSWPLLDLNLGLICAWGLALHEATALAWSWTWAWACVFNSLSYSEAPKLDVTNNNFIWTRQLILSLLLQLTAQIHLSFYCVLSRPLSLVSSPCHQLASLACILFLR